jgi:hypothetical protein
MDAIITGSGDTRMADQDVCIAVGEDLTKHYPGYYWMVGCDHQAGSVQIDLQVPKPVGLERYGYRLNISTILGAGGQQAVVRAGGELLERFGLRRGRASADTDDIVREHGLDVSNNKNKSKY